MHEQSGDPFYFQRQMMVEKQLAGRDIVSKVVLETMGDLARHEFVPDKYRSESYTDNPLPIGFEQTISQPYIVALMTQLARVDASSHVLEIGTGSGYQTAVLASIAAEVSTIEIVEPLFEQARSTLLRLGFENVHFHCGDGHGGLPERAPFDAIVVTAAPPRVPQALIEQLKDGGRLVIPVGSDRQELLLIVKCASGESVRSIVPVKFVLMTGEDTEL